MSPSRPHRRPARAVLAVLVTALATLAATVVTGSPAQARSRVTPGSFTGFGFDACHAPSQEAMDAWLTGSRYWAVGVYIAGVNRYCPDQENLDATWIHRQLRHGWRVLPLTVGLQASCNGVKRYRGKKISPDPLDDYRAAREQGAAEARDTVAAAQQLDIRKRSTLWFDIEAYDTSRTRCRESALSFLSSWTQTLHEEGYRSGVYSSAASGIKALDDALTLTPGAYAMPDQVWIADWNGHADVDSEHVRADSWMPNRRVHQFRGGHDERHGGVTINVDSSYMSLGRGSLARRVPPHCRTNLDFPRYRWARQGRHNDQVAAAQCLLRHRRLYRGRVNGYFTRRTYWAVRHFQRRHDLPVNGVLTPRTWVTLLSQGRTPLMKIGSAGNAVRRLQRALNAADGARLEISGVYDVATTRAVRRYQRDHHLPHTGVVTDDVWDLLHDGRR